MTHTSSLRRACLLAFAALLCVPSAAIAQDDGKKGAEPEKAPAYTRYPDKPAVTAHRIQLMNESVDYLAVADTMALVDDEDKEQARVFYISYRRCDLTRVNEDLAREIIGDEAFDRVMESYEGPGERATRLAQGMVDAGRDPLELFAFPNPAERPITFSFNGGPGSSSVWLHLGLFGPKRVAYADEMGSPGAPPYAVVVNLQSMLDKSDFVFIDPVSTGYSRAAIGENARDFHGVEPDIRSVAEFIRRYITREQRWGSPKLIAGESYGTTRAAGLARELHDTHGIGLNGIVLVSSILQFQTARFDTGNDLPYVCFLPTYAATAHYHGALEDRYQAMPVAEFLAEVKEFASGEYAAALMDGDTIEPTRAREIARRVAAYSGLSVDYVERANLRPVIYQFTKELLREQRRTVGRLDSRFIGIDRDSVGDGYEYDPSYAAIQANYTASLNAYVRSELGFESDLPYEILTGVGPWNYGPTANNQYLDVAERMRSIMHKQPNMRVFVASGYYDLATPFFGTEYTMSHLGLAPERRENIEIHEYEAGHMMYIHRPSLEKIKGDLDAFYDRAVGG